MSFVERARKYQQDIEHNKITRRIDREQRYREFLENPPRHLPPLQSLVKLRNIMFLIVFIVLLVPSLQVLLFLDSLFYYPTCDLCVWSGSLGCMIFAFGLMFDYAIYKRFGNEESIMKW